MCGRATFTIEVSSTSSVAPSITASATSHLCDSARGGVARADEVNFGAVAIYVCDRMRSEKPARTQSGPRCLVRWRAKAVPSHLDLENHPPNADVSEGT